jgi:hypothetical protein
MVSESSESESGIISESLDELEECEDEQEMKKNKPKTTKNILKLIGI